MGSRSYKAIKIVQRPDAAPFYVLGVDAPEILEWADVPRKKAAYMAGYQRELDDRHEKLTKFLKQDPKNIVPGAIIIAVRSDAVNIEEIGDGVVNLTISQEQASNEELVNRLHERFRSRLSESELKSIELISQDLDDSQRDSDLDESDDSDDDPIPESYLARLTAELGLAVRDGLDQLLPDRRSAIEEYVQGTAKPGLILDGQHRVFAAKNIDTFDVRLPVVVLPGLETSEQVFHFYVLNNKAKPLKPTELRSTISTSLSNKEIEGLYDRLKSTGVDSEEASWTHKIQTDESSPFRSLVDFGFKDTGGFIPENVLFQVAKKFMKPARRFTLLTKDVDGWTDDGVRLGLFYSFWGAIKEKYSNAWQVGIEDSDQRQIFYKATMVCLQELLFESLAKGMPSRARKKLASPFADPIDLFGEVEAALFFLPEEFFLKKWQETGLDTKERREFLKGQMEQAINKQGEKLGTIQLFKNKQK
jgi:hypothetical protein